MFKIPVADHCTRSITNHNFIVNGQKTFIVNLTLNGNCNKCKQSVDFLTKPAVSQLKSRFMKTVVTCVNEGVQNENLAFCKSRKEKWNEVKIFRKRIGKVTTYLHNLLIYAE